ncbi:MAG: TonB family protein [Betaproteobacteria bacterium]|nr:TonB family protein [Betaproteobacteria bacterium]
MADTTGRTFICSVVFVDLVEYSKKSVAEQILLKETCNALIAEAIDAVPPDARIVLDTGDGAAITFLGDPEDALFVGLKLRDSIEEALTSHSIGIGRHKANGHLRVGVNLGPVKIATNVNGGANIVGDGIAVAERIMGFALPGQMLVSRSFFEMVSRLSDDYGSLFRHDGQRSDANGRVHELYLAGRDTTALQTAERGARERKKIASGDHAPLAKASVARGGPTSNAGRITATAAAATLPPTPPSAEMAALVATGQMSASTAPPFDTSGAEAPSSRRFLEDHYKVGFVALLLTLTACFQAFLVWQKKGGSTSPATALALTKPADPAPAVQPTAVPPPATMAPATAKPAPNEPPATKTAATDASAKPAAGGGKTVSVPDPTVPPKRAPEPTPPKVSATQPPQPAARKTAPEPVPLPPTRTATPDKQPVPASAVPVKAQAAPVARKAEPLQPAPLALQIPPVAPVQQTQTPAPAPAPQVIAPVEPAKPAPTTIITKVSGGSVEFPAEAVRAGVTSGYVRVRVRIDANGTPVDVTIVESRPSRVFDRAVRNTLSVWRFNPGADNRIYEAQIDFNR